MSALYVVCYHSGPVELFLIWLGPVSSKAIKVIKMEQNQGGCRKESQTICVVSREVGRFE